MLVINQPQHNIISSTPLVQLDGTAYATDAVVTGIGTSFTTQLEVDDWISLYGYVRKVTDIASDTELTVDEAFTGTDTQVIYRIGTDFFAINPNGRLVTVSTLDQVYDVPLYAITSDNFQVTATTITLRGSVSFADGENSVTFDISNLTANRALVFPNLAGTIVVGIGTGVSVPTGGSVVDDEARTALGELIEACQAAGLLTA